MMLMMILRCDMMCDCDDVNDVLKQLRKKRIRASHLLKKNKLTYFKPFFFKHKIFHIQSIQN